MTATQTIDISGLRNGLKISHRKENAGLHRSYQVLDLVKRHDSHEAFPVITVRTYWPSSVCYACVWIISDGMYFNGSGRAGGHGYCKESAAIDSAFRSAGVKYDIDMHGSGLDVVRVFLAGLAKTIGLTDFVIVESHG